MSVNMKARVRKSPVHLMAERMAVFLCFFIAVFYTPQTSNDVGILREEILDKMQYDSQQLEPLLKYYAKISPAKAQILRVKSMLIKGEYEEALIRLTALRSIV